MGLNVYIQRHDDKYLYQSNCSYIKIFIQDALNATDSQTEDGVVITRDLIKRLIDSCDIVLKNHSAAEDVLPTYSDNYDKYYFESVDCTKNDLIAILNQYPDDSFVYSDRW